MWYYRRVSTKQSNNCNCNRNYILFTKLPWPGDSEGTFRSSSQAATCPPVDHTQRRLHTVPLIAERQAGKLWIPIFIVFGMTRPRIEPESTVSVADALSTRSKYINKILIDVYIFSIRTLFFIKVKLHLNWLPWPKFCNKSPQSHALNARSTPTEMGWIGTI